MLCVVTSQVTETVLLLQHSVASMLAGVKLCPASGWYQGYIAPSSEADSIASVPELYAHGIGWICALFSCPFSPSKSQHKSQWIYQITFYPQKVTS